jgi:hypothetical protein
MKQIALTLARCLFGLFYAVIGGYYAYQFFTNPGATWPAFNLAEKKLVAAMMEAKFFGPSVSLTCLFGGIATLFNRTAPLGLLLLSPVIMIIFLYHLYLTGAYLHAGVQFAYLAALLFLYRDAFIPLWNYKRPAI